MSDKIVISRDELFTDRVEEAVARQRALQRRGIPEPENLSPIRRLLMSGMFYLPIAGLLGAIGAWLIVEPGFDDYAIIGGEVRLVNTDPFDLTFEGGGSNITVGDIEVIIIPGQTRFEKGADGQDPITDVRKLEIGDTVEASGLPAGPQRILAFGLRPASPAHAKATGQDMPGEYQWVQFLLFPMTAGMIVLLIFLMEGLTSRNWVRMAERGLIGTALAFGFAFLALVPAGLFMLLAGKVFEGSLNNNELVTARNMDGGVFITYMACRSAAWACVGAGLGTGMNLVRSTKIQLRNTLMGGALGGAIGGLFFDPIDRFFAPDTMFGGAELSRAIGLAAVGLAVGVFVALSERLAREAWVRVRTGPLAGKSFVLYRTPTVVGSAPQADIYLFKDADIDPEHAAIHKVGGHYEIEDMGSRTGTLVKDNVITRRRLTSGDQIVVGATVLEFEERAKTRALAGRVE